MIGNSIHFLEIEYPFREGQQKSFCGLSTANIVPVRCKILLVFIFLTFKFVVQRYNENSKINRPKYFLASQYM